MPWFSPAKGSRSVGVDLPAIVSGARTNARWFFPQMNCSFEHLATFPKLPVAAANGHAIAGGAIVMLACDQ